MCNVVIKRYLGKKTLPHHFVVMLKIKCVAKENSPLLPIPLTFQ